MKQEKLKAIVDVLDGTTWCIAAATATKHLFSNENWNQTKKANPQMDIVENQKRH